MIPRTVRPVLVYFLSLVLEGCAASTTFVNASSAPDTIYWGGNVLTINDEVPVAEAFAVREDRFVAVGENSAIRALAGPNTRIVDLAGKTVVPGFSDSHDHLWNSARWQYRGVDMIGVQSWREMAARLRPVIAKAKPGQAVFTTLGWELSKAPGLAKLDELSPDVPLVLVRSRQGKGFVNSAALRSLGITKENPYFEGTKVPVDSSGEPTGEPPGYPYSLRMMLALTPKMSPAIESEVILKAMAARNALGITSTRELSVWPEGVAAFRRMRREGRMTLRMSLGVEYPDQEKTAEYLATLPHPQRGDPWLMVDTAAEEPWPPGSTTLAAFTTYARKARGLGFRLAPHVSADRSRKISYDVATDDTLKAYETLDQEKPLAGERWFLEHVPFSTPDEIGRMARLGLIVSVQYAGYAGPNDVNLPADRLENVNPVGSLLAHGLTVIAGSDFTSPTVEEAQPNNPMIPFFFYVTRMTKSGQLVGPDQRIDRLTALKLFTANAAYATFQENQRGQIKSGMLADFVILNQDLMKVPENQILQTHPLATFVGGRLVYAARRSGF